MLPADAAQRLTDRRGPIPPVLLGDRATRRRSALPPIAGASIASQAATTTGSASATIPQHAAVV